MLEVGQFPIRDASVLDWQQCIRNNLTLLVRGRCAMRHVWNEWKAGTILVESLIRCGSAARTEGK